MALMSVLTIVFVLAILSALVLYLGGKELGLSAVRLLGAQSLYVAEGGAVAARSALMALMNAGPVGITTVDNSLTAATLNAWYAAGAPAGQNSFSIFDYLVLNGLRYTTGANNASAALTFHVNWALPELHRKLQFGGSPPSNALGAGTYAASVVITRRLIAHSSCTPPLTPCYIHRLGPTEYEYFYTYTITSDGQMPPRARRRVTLTSDFSIRVRPANFAEYVLFTNVHTTPSGGALWFQTVTTFDGPVHSNGQFRFRLFARMGTPDATPPCDPSQIASIPLTSVSGTAIFWNNGTPVTLAANENVVGGVRRDAPVLPDCTPANTADDNDNPPANFTRGVPAIPYPTNPYSQKGASIGRDPNDTSAVTDLQIRQAVPELADNGVAVPAGIYVPVVDTILIPANTSNDGEPMGGGIYVQGNLDSLTLSSSGNNALYTLVQGAQTVTVTVDRTLGTTTVTNSAWAFPQTRTFVGVPKGWQPLSNPNATMIYVEGTILGLGGTLEEKEQTMIAASGRIDITDHVRYEDPPNVYDPNDDPLNVLGIYSSNSDIRITTAAPNDVDIHAVLMVGNAGDGYNSSVYVQDYNLAPPRGPVHLIGGLIEEYYGQFGVTDPLNQFVLAGGRGRDFRYDRRMSRGFSPPYFPTTSNRFEIAEGTNGLAGVRPIWREASP
jgi:hypothetical protein